MKLALIYTLLAAVATVANIASQDIVTRLYAGPFLIELSILIGTGVGLIVKYVLDKRYIFRFTARDVVHDGQTFILYAFMGVFTTSIFWGFEFTFQHLFATREMRYVGAAIGLALGYYTKYQLDRRFVFCQQAV